MNQYRTVARGVAGAIILSMAAATAAVFPASAQAQSLEQVVQQLNEKRRELQEFQSSKVKPKETEVREAQRQYNQTADVVDVARDGMREAQRVVNRYKAALRDLQDKQFILSFGTDELAGLFKKFDEATTNEEATRIGRLIFRARFGLSRQPPPNFTRLADVIFQEKIKFRREAVALIGPALIGIGQVVVSIVDVKTAGLKPRQEAFGDFVGPFFKPVFTHLKIWSKIMGTPILPQDQLAKEAKRINGELTRIRDQDLFGHPEGREAAKKAIVEARASIEARLSKTQSVIDQGAGELAKAEDRLEEASEKVSKAQAELDELKKQEQPLLEAVRQLQQKSLEVQTKEILREATGRRIGVDGRLDLTDADGRGRSTAVVAVDNLTSAILNIPKRLRGHVSSTYEVEETIECEECRRRSSTSDEIVCTPRTVKTFRRISIPDDPDARMSSGGGALRVTGRAVDGASPGEGVVRAFLPTGVANVRNENSVCGPIRVVQQGPAKEIIGANVGVAKVSNLRFEGFDKDQKQIDLFVIAGDTLGVTRADRTTLRLVADVEGPVPAFNRQLNLQPRISGSTRGLSFPGGRQGQGSTLSVLARGGGANTDVAFVVEGDRGQELERVQMKVTSNALSARAPGDELEIFEKGRFQILVGGRGNTNGFTAKWFFSGISESGAMSFQQETSFSGGRTSNEFFFETLAFAGAMIEVRADIFDGEKQIASVTFPEVRLIARLSDMRFVLAGSDIGVAALDIFTPINANLLPGIELQVRDVNRNKVTFNRFSSIRPTITQTGLPILKIGPNTDINRTIDGRAIASSTEVGSGTLVSEFDLRAAREKGIVFSNSGGRSRIVESVLLTLNRLTVERQQGQNGEEFVLKSVGPAAITGYTATFHFTGGQTETTGFEASAFGGEARVLVNGRRFIRADVARQTGRVVGSVSSALDGQPLPPATVRLEIPPEGASGGSVVVRGIIENVQHNDSFDLRCEWEVDPTLGTLRDETTSVSPTGETGGICINALTLSDDPSNVNRDVNIGIRISRQIGSGDPS